MAKVFSLPYKDLSSLRQSMDNSFIEAHTGLAVVLVDLFPEGIAYLQLVKWFAMAKMFS